MDLLERQLSNGLGEKVLLTSMDFNLLRMFAEHAGETLERSRLMEQTRGRDLGPLDRSLDVQISRLRQRLQDDGKQPDLIKTVRGSGYVFSADVTNLSNV
jgi:DNA-binding response OmpR family regulator